METRALGASGLQVSRLGLGLAALGRPGYVNLGHGADIGRKNDVAALERRTHSVLDAAWKGGVRYYDAARSYGRAEEFLASWLARRGIAPAAVAIGSKWGYIYTAGWHIDAALHEIKDHTLPNLQLQWQESRALLGPYLRLYQIHSATFDSGVLENGDVLAELGRLKAGGLLIGLSLSGPDQPAVLTRAATITIDGVPLFDTVQATWNLLETSAGPVLAAAHARGMGVIVKEALANGRLTNRNSDLAFAARRLLLERQALRLNTSLDALALAAVLAQPWADVVLSGAVTTDQLRSNLRALAVHWDDEAAAALGGLVEEPVNYWQTRRALPWN